jgi:exodeoxyribonuclease-3
MEENKPDVVCLQETKTTDDKFPKEEFSKLGYACEFFGEKTYNGVALISNRPIKQVCKGFREEPETSSKRFLEAQVDGVKILNTYIPNGQAVGSEKFFYKLTWLEGLRKHIANEHKPTSPIVLCGDFNVALEDIDIYDPQANAGQIMCSEKERDAMKRIQSFGFVDAFRLHQKEGGYYSWWDYRMGAFRRNMGFRIDHIWVTLPLASKTKRCWIDKAPRKLERPSDHAPVVAEFAI